MFAIAARKMGYRVHTLSPDTDTPTGQVADVEIAADYDDLDAVAHFAKQVHVVTFEFENVSAAAADTAAKYAPVRPAGRVLHTTQHRLREKNFLQQHNFPHAPPGQFADAEIAADYDDLDAVAHFAKQVHVVTFEFENVSAAAADTAAKYAPVRPAGRVLHTTQHRLREKNFLKQHNFPHAP